MIYLIRHGETEANIKHIYCGSTDLPLSAEGIRKLKELHYETDGAGFITSGMTRTEQTLELLFGSVSHRQEPRFREIDFGIFEMHSYDELKDTPEYQQWLAGDNEANVCPDGESGRQMEARVMEAFGEVQRSGCSTVIVTHGGVIAAIMANLFPEEAKSRFDWQPAPGHGYVIKTGIGYEKL